MTVHKRKNNKEITLHTIFIPIFAPSHKPSPMQPFAQYIRYFTTLRRAHNLGGAPHKPVLLLSILDAVERGYITSQRVYITAELIALFKSNWNIWVKTPHTRDFTLPFYHLSSEPFWNLVVKPGMTIPLTSRKSIRSFAALVQTVDYAEIDIDLFFYMSRDTERSILRKAITDRYFTDIMPVGISNTYYLDIVAEQILHDSAVQYKKTINRLQQTEDNENFEEEIFLRNNVFKQRIPQIYDYTCCISGLRVRSPQGHSLIDACHIIPFSQEHDDTIGNGIALCPNLHRAFDNGLITIDTDYRVVVSQGFTENVSMYSVRQFENKKILLPENEKFHPRREVLQWHNERVFESGR